MNMTAEVMTHLKGIGIVAWAVIATLLAMSIVSIGIIVERWWVYRRANRQSKTCALEASRLLRAGRLREAQEMTMKPNVRESHLARVLATGLREWDQEWQDGEDAVRIETVKTAVRHATAESVGDLRRGLVVLGTIASTAPFVGLFGTTFGIINAFAAMAAGGGTGMGDISAGISEALITTAFGLFVAVPAVWAYNYFAGKVEGFNVEMDNSSSELLDYFIKKGA